MPERLKKGDQIVFFLALTLVLGLYYVYWGGSNHAQQAQIIVAGKKPIIHDMSESKMLEIEGILGKSIIEIHEGRIRIVQSPCSGKLCVRSGWISQVNDFIACLPNGISIFLIGSDARYDSINF